ncbi:MAG: zinc ABC transporter substrate-binding protein [Candidatus Krumholzibacteriia bacterium]
MLLSFALLAGCGGEGGDGGGGGGSERDAAAAGKAAGKLNVATTTMQTGDLVREIGGDDVALTVLMGPGLDPHQYKASAGDVERLGRADLIVYNGLHLEAKMAEVLERLDARQPTLAAAEAVPEDRLITQDGARDPHVWFDVELWRFALDAVEAKLSELDPERAGAYRERADRLRGRFDELHAYARKEFARIPEDQRVLVTAHDAFNYLGRAYGLEVVGLQGISTASEAGTGDVQALAALIADRRIPAMFVETSVSPRAIEAVQQAVRARGHQVVVGGEVYSDAMGDTGTPAGTYVGMIHHNVDTIVAALAGEANP